MCYLFGCFSGFHLPFHLGAAVRVTLEAPDIVATRNGKTVDLHVLHQVPAQVFPIKRGKK